MISWICTNIDLRFLELIFVFFKVQSIQNQVIDFFNPALLLTIWHLWSFKWSLANFRLVWKCADQRLLLTQAFKSVIQAFVRPLISSCCRILGGFLTFLINIDAPQKYLHWALVRVRLTVMFSPFSFLIIAPFLPSSLPVVL